MNEKDKRTAKTIGKIFLWIFVPYVMVYKLVLKKTSERKTSLFIAGLTFLFYFVLIFTSNPDTQKEVNSQTVTATKTIKTTPTTTIQPTAKPTKNPQEIYDDWVKKQFSAWDGSCYALVSLLKKNLNDDSSFEHVETKYIVNADLDTLTIIMSYRAKNAFGAKVLNTCTATASKSKDQIIIVSNE